MWITKRIMCFSLQQVLTSEGELKLCWNGVPLSEDKYQLKHDVGYKLLLDVDKHFATYQSWYEQQPVVSDRSSQDINNSNSNSNMNDNSYTNINAHRFIYVKRQIPDNDEAVTAGKLAVNDSQFCVVYASASYDLNMLPDDEDDDSSVRESHEQMFVGPNSDYKHNYQTHTTAYIFDRQRLLTCFNGSDYFRHDFSHVMRFFHYDSNVYLLAKTGHGIMSVFNLSTMSTVGDNNHCHDDDEQVNKCKISWSKDGDAFHNAIQVTPDKQNVIVSGWHWMADATSYVCPYDKLLLTGYKPEVTICKL